MSVKHGEYKKSIDVILKCWNVNTDAFQLNSFSVLIVPGDRTQLSVRLLLKKKKGKEKLTPPPRIKKKQKTPHPTRVACLRLQADDLTAKGKLVLHFPRRQHNPHIPTFFFFRYFLSDSVNPQSQGVGVGVGGRGTGQKRDRGNVRVLMSGGLRWYERRRHAERLTGCPHPSGSFGPRGKFCIPVWTWALSRNLRSPERKKRKAWALGNNGARSQDVA